MAQRPMCHPDILRAQQEANEADTTNDVEAEPDTASSESEQPAVEAEAPPASEDSADAEDAPEPSRD